MSDLLRFKPHHSDAAKGKKHIVVVGGGIIGACTAYYLVQHPKFDPAKYHITLLESKRVAGGASGKAGGLLALWAFPQQLVPLLFNLHQELADLYNGELEWDYRRLSTVLLEGDISGNAEGMTPAAAPAKVPRKNATLSGAKGKLPKALDWIAQEYVTLCLLLGGTDTTAQVHPYRFTSFILRKAVELANGGLELVLGKVTRIRYLMETGAATGVDYEPTSLKEKAGKRLSLFADDIVLAVGPWTLTILPDCPILGLRAHSITVAPYQNQPVLPYAIFTEFKTGPSAYVSPEIYARKDEVYVCGEGDSAVDVPETTDDVEVVKSKCDELYKNVSKMSELLRKGHILKRQACYLPVLDVPSLSGPLIGETNVENLYLCLGHSCWGINNAPGSGKIMSELIMDGKVTSANISSLDPSLYFDALVLVDGYSDISDVEGPLGERL